MFKHDDTTQLVHISVTRETLSSALFDAGIDGPLWDGSQFVFTSNNLRGMVEDERLPTRIVHIPVGSYAMHVPDFYRLI